MNVDLLRCQDCTLAYGAKIPAEPNDIYSDRAYVPSTQSEYDSTVAYRKQRFGRERLTLIESIIGPLTGKKILDVGCGLGWFLEVAQDQGMVISGIELGSDLAKSASQTLGITVHQTTLENLPKEAAFDVIVMFDLIEHVPDPLSLVLEAKKRLKPRGILLAFTPNFDSLSITVQGGHSNLLMPTDHLQLFNRESVDHLANLVAMNLEYFQVAGIDMGDLKSHFEWLGDMDQAAACETLQDSLQPTLDRKGLGNHLRFALKK